MPLFNITAPASAAPKRSKRVAGNLAYAVLATMIDRRTQYHRARLSEHISALSPSDKDTSRSLRTQLFHHGCSAGIYDGSFAMIDDTRNRQATMLAYNGLLKGRASHQ
ncbi:MAG: hypothetical protein ACREQE_08250 [Candidatus Binataceae bacterium]